MGAFVWSVLYYYLFIHFFFIVVAFYFPLTRRGVCIYKRDVECYRSQVIYLVLFSVAANACNTTFYHTFLGFRWQFCAVMISFNRGIRWIFDSSLVSCDCSICLHLGFVMWIGRNHLCSVTTYSRVTKFWNRDYFVADKVLELDSIARKIRFIPGEISAA